MKKLYVYAVCLIIINLISSGCINHPSEFAVSKQNLLARITIIDAKWQFINEKEIGEGKLLVMAQHPIWSAFTLVWLLKEVAIYSVNGTAKSLTPDYQYSTDISPSDTIDIIEGKKSYVDIVDKKMEAVHHEALKQKNKDISITLLIAIFGGLITYYVPKLIQYVRFKYKPILVYQFDDHGTDQDFRRIKHSFGKVENDPDASNDKAWEHTSDRINEGDATCYGPYTKEIAFSGRYKARYRIKAIGINKDLIKPILVLDITHGERNDKGELVTLGLPLIEKPLLRKDFKEGKYNKYDLSFQYDGQSFIEFRCMVKDPIQYEQNVKRILFDNVKVFRIIEFF
jgi:hypothetical protein